MPHRCPIWVGYLLASPLRKLAQHPTAILSPYVRESMTVLDVGCAMGFFSIPMAQRVGATGRVICLDVQPKMLQVLERRARQAGVAARIVARPCLEEMLDVKDLAGQIDFALAFAVVHEVSNPAVLFSEIFAILKPDAHLLIAEPKGHVTADQFEETLHHAQRAGFKLCDRPQIRRSHTALLIR